MRSKLIASLAGTTLLAGSMAFTAVPAHAAAPATTGVSTSSVAPSTASVSSTINQVFADGSSFVGSFSPTGFTSQNGRLNVTGLVTGTYTSATGATTPVSQTVTTAVTNATTSGSCKVLSLQLGPLHLNLLGLVVDLNQVNLNITAQSGPGNLLGNLLCSVTNLLNGSGTGGLANLLNNLLGL